MSPPPSIALIDDDRVWLETLGEYLHGQGYPVHMAVGGTRGLALLEEAHIGLAVVDFHMPDLNGLDLLRHLRRRRRNVDVLLMSSDDDPELPARARAEGAAGFLSKSLAPSLLLRTLIQTLSATLTEMALRPPYYTRWDLHLPMPRPAQAWLPVSAKACPPSRN